MFFPRLRRHTKWMFVLLALVFGLGFVVFGVGAGGTGIGDIFRGRSSGGTTKSVSSAQKEVKQHPGQPQGYRDLATALQADGKTDESIVPLERYTQLKPKDADAYGELAGLYLARANREQRRGQDAQLAAADVTGGSIFGANLQLGSGQTLGQDPVSQAVQTQSNTVLTDAYSKASAAYSKAESTYKRLVLVRPEDPSIRLQLATTAQQGGDIAGAIAAYKAFLKLAPDDSNAPLVKAQLKQLRQAQQSQQSQQSPSG